MRQFVYSPFGDKNLVLFYLWWTEFALKYEKYYKQFSNDCLKIFFLISSTLKMYRIFKNNQFLVEKSKSST